MSTQPVYPAARAAAARIQHRFENRFTTTGLSKDTVASLPDSATVAFMIDAAFWASLRREESYTPLISLAFISPEQSVNPLRFERSLPLGSKALTKLAPAVERPGIHLGVWPDGDELRVWGATRHLPPLCFVLEVFAPGLLVVKRSRSEESGKCKHRRHSGR